MCAQAVIGMHVNARTLTLSHTLIPWLKRLAMKGGVGSIPFCFKLWSNIAFVVKGVDLKEVA